MFQGVFITYPDMFGMGVLQRDIGHMALTDARIHVRN